MSNEKEYANAYAYPTERQYEQWKAEAQEYGVSVSQYIQNMVEAGRKKFTAEVEYDETQAELRAQRNDLKDELDYARERISELEADLHRSEREAVREFIQQQSSGVTFEEVGQHIVNTAPERVNRHLEHLEGEDVQYDPESGQYYSRAVEDQNSAGERMGGGGDASG